MILPSTLNNKAEWTFAGPMGPALPPHLQELPLVCVDGGAHYTERMDIWIGDGDSCRAEISAPHLFQVPPEKDESDFALALNLFSLPLHYKFHLWGFLGGRKDHELFNLGECLRFLERHPECQALLYNQTGKVSFHLLGEGFWKFAYEGLFSLGTLKKTNVRLTGRCDYEIKKFKTISPLSSFGLSNQGRGEMILENEGPVFLYFPEGK